MDVETKPEGVFDNAIRCIRDFFINLRDSINNFLYGEKDTISLVTITRPNDAGCKAPSVVSCWYPKDHLPQSSIVEIPHNPEQISEQEITISEIELTIMSGGYASQKPPITNSSLLRSSSERVMSRENPVIDEINSESDESSENNEYTEIIDDNANDSYEQTVDNSYCKAEAETLTPFQKPPLRSEELVVEPLRGFDQNKCCVIPMMTKPCFSENLRCPEKYEDNNLEYACKILRQSSQKQQDTKLDEENEKINVFANFSRTLMEMIDEKNKDFIKKNGRGMTYEEMNEHWG